MLLWLLGPALALLTTLNPSLNLQPTPVAELLQRYSRGQSVETAISQHIATADTFEIFLSDLKREARKFPPPLASTFALEAASVAFRETPMEAVRKDLPNALAILEIGCSTLREASPNPSDFERRWHVLAADLITSSTRRKSGSAETSWFNFFLPYDRHFQHARARNDSYARLSLSLARYEHARFYVWRLMDGFSIVNAKGIVPRRYEGFERLKAVLAHLEDLLSHPEFAEEAHVRSADALLYLGSDEEGLSLLGDKAFKDKTWEYLRRLIRARQFLRSGQTGDAAREYEAANRTDPRARAANLTLAGLAYLAGQQDLAGQLASAANESSEPDPWMLYMYPGATDWHVGLAALRKDARGQ